LQSTTAFSQAFAQQQHDVLDSSTASDLAALTASPASSPHAAEFSCTSWHTASSAATAAPYGGQLRGSSGSIDQRLSWSLRPADTRQLPEGMLALAAEARAAQQRSTKAALKTEVSLATLMGSPSSQSSGVQGLKLLGSNFAWQEAPASNIQLVAGSPLGTGLHTRGARLARGFAAADGQQQQQQQQQWGRQAGLLQQLPRPASAPCYSPASSSLSTWGPPEGLCDPPHAARAGRYRSPQPQVPSPSIWSPLSVTAAGAAGASARDKLH
jgi:hypothetical protein